MPSTNDYVNITLLGDLPPVGSWPPILNFMWITYEKENDDVWKSDTISKNGSQCTVGDFGGSHRHCYFIQPIIGIYGSLSIVVWLCHYLDTGNVISAAFCVVFKWSKYSNWSEYPHIGVCTNRFIK